MEVSCLRVPNLISSMHFRHRRLFRPALPADLSPRRKPSLASPRTIAFSAVVRNQTDGPGGYAGEVLRNKLLQVVLVSPQIPGNTGCIARTCAASAVGLHLVQPLGYRIDDTKLKRAGLDYWPSGDWLVFGSETCGLPPEALLDCSTAEMGGGTIRIPMVETYVRCLNLSVSVGIALYEAARQLNYAQLRLPHETGSEAQRLFSTEDIFC